MGKVKDISGERRGRLLVVRFTGLNKHRKAMWECRCDCGSVVNASSNLLQRGHVSSCGCLRDDMLRRLSRTHGLRSHNMYKTWAAMRNRCTRPDHSSYHNYGGRGITICDRWKDLAVFIEDMSPRPSMKHQIDRIDNDGNYEPGNCRWLTKKEQARNRRTNRILECRGERMTIVEWSERVETKKGTIRSRIGRGWPAEEALFGRTVER